MLFLLFLNTLNHYFALAFISFELYYIVLISCIKRVHNNIIDINAYIFITLSTICNARFYYIDFVTIYREMRVVLSNFDKTYLLGGNYE